MFHIFEHTRTNRHESVKAAKEEIGTHVQLGYMGFPSCILFFFFFFTVSSGTNLPPAIKEKSSKNKIYI